MLHLMQAAADTNGAVEPPTTDAQDATLQQIPHVQEAEKQLPNKKVYIASSSCSAVNCYMPVGMNWLLSCLVKMACCK